MQGLYDMTSNFIRGVVTGDESNETSLSTSAVSKVGPPRMVLQRVSYTESKILAVLPPIVNSSVIPVGQEYFIKLRHIGGEPIVETSGEDHNVGVADDSVIIIPPNITPENLDQFTYYEILGLSSFGDSADRFLIRKAYRQAVLLYHPDKMHSRGHTEEECRAIFLRVQAAAETLTDVSKRRAYDSLLDFDESIPTEAETKEASLAGVEEFLKLFEPVFKRNARFALTKPVPSIGSTNTPVRHVNSFYNYWVKFDSWRDFTNVEREHDPEQAQCREHKRWMAKENEKHAKKLKKKEMARVLEFVTRALTYDPRLIAEKERVKNEKAAQKVEHHRKKAQEQTEREERTKRMEEEKERSAREEKSQHERARKQASKSRNTFRKLLRVAASLSSESQTEPETHTWTQTVGDGDGGVGGEYGIMTAADCDLICQSTDTVQLLAFNEKMGGEAAIADNSAFVTAATAEVLSYLSSLKQSTEQKKQEALKQTELLKQEHDKSAIASSLKKKGVNREWTGQEFSMLSKGIKKFPAGSRQRWVTICNFMNDLLKPEEPYTKEECLQASQNAMKIMTASTFKTSTATATVTATTSTTATVSAPSPTPSLTATTATPLSSSKQKEVKAKPKAVAIPAADKDNKTKEEDALIWSQEQQKQLESGLKKYPASMDKNERWVAISGDIPGKTKKDCILRFKKLREDLQQQATAKKK